MQKELKQIAKSMSVLAERMDKFEKIQKSVPKVERPKTKTTLEKEETFDGEKVVGKVVISAIRPTKSGNGVMVSFKGTRNYYGFVKSAWTDKVAVGKLCKVTEHKGKTGNISHAIRIGRKAAVYTKAK